MKRLTARLTSTRFAKQVTREHEKGAGLAVPVSGVNVACPRGNLPPGQSLTGAISPGQSPRGNLTGAIPCHPCTESNLERTWFPEIGFRRLVCGDWFPEIGFCCSLEVVLLVGW